MIFVDSNHFDSQLRDLNEAMFRFARDTGISMEKIVRKNTGLLQQDLVNSVPPGDRKETEKAIRRDVNRYFRPMPSDPFPLRKAEGKGTRKAVKKGQSLEGRMRWLYASAKGSVLLGVAREMFSKSPGLAAMRQTMKEKPAFGNAYNQIGTRGKQRVLQLNRIVTSRANYSKLLRDVSRRIGKLKASFAWAWYDGVAAPQGRKLPEWIKRHLDSRKARGSYQANLEDKHNVYITLTSQSPGCESELSSRAIRTAMKKRTKSILSDIKYYVKGIKDVAKYSPFN